MKEALEVAVLNLIAPIGVITSFLFIWFKTDFFLSYLKLFNFKFPDYEKQSIENPDLFFFEYLACKNSSSKFKFFIFKLISFQSLTINFTNVFIDFVTDTKFPYRI